MLTVPFGAAVAAPKPDKEVKAVFEAKRRLIGPGRSPWLVARRQHGLMMAYSRQGDLFFQSSNDLGDTFTEPLPINSVAAEVSDHGENGPQLLSSPGDRELYAVWNARTPNAPGKSDVRFSRSSAMQVAWSPAITVNDGPPASHNFQGAAVAADGAIYAGWLDSRDPGGSSVYVTCSTDGGKSFAPNVRVVGNVCPCCRVSIGTVGNRVVLSWRQVEAGDIRDIFTAVSEDHGKTWSQPALVARDAWKISGCPHCGPSLAGVGDTLWIAWMSEGGGEPAVYIAQSRDGGRTFSQRVQASGETLDPTHPRLATNGENLALVFQAREAGGEQGWGKFVAWYREVYPDGSMSALQQAPAGDANTSYPSLALGLSGRLFMGWSELSDGAPHVALLRARAARPPKSS
ncbi:MAG: exo-alpha-sialidase [Bryobacterales bacterium]|nr:exo-alpha-sialidase [Bryobacterales bacterium]